MNRQRWAATRSGFADLQTGERNLSAYSGIGGGEGGRGVGIRRDWKREGGAGWEVRGEGRSSESEGAGRERGGKEGRKERLCCVDWIKQEGLGVTCKQ